MTAVSAADDVLQVPHIVAGQIIHGSDVSYRSGSLDFATPTLDLDLLVLSRSEPGPAFDLSSAEIVSFLVETGRRIDVDTNEHVRAAIEGISRQSNVSARVIKEVYRQLPSFFERDALEFQVEHQIGRRYVDGWSRLEVPGAEPCMARAFPPRVAHIMAGNSPVVAAMSLVRGALTKGIHLFKPAANDLLTAQALLQTMIDIDPDHPTVRSMYVAYWRGGDRVVEGALFRPQYFDKLVAWGGESSIRNALSYAGPGLEVITYDPKVSISLVGSEAFCDDATLTEVARRAAADVAKMNQDGCACSRFQFIEGSVADADRYCAALSKALGVDIPLGDGTTLPTPGELREEIDALRSLEPHYRVWGDFGGKGVVIRSDEPVDFAPAGKTVNVVVVPELQLATQWVTVATQTVGIYPDERKTDLRDGLACAGAQRVVSLGESGGGTERGVPHDGHYPLQRLMRWVYDA
jgi:Acyl-CoA reductase (LuxC)